MQWIRSTVNTLSNQALNAKGHVILTLGGKALSIQNEFHNPRTHCGCEEAILTYIEAGSKCKAINRWMIYVICSQSHRYSLSRL